jgi:hypothetical protein
LQKNCRTTTLVEVDAVAEKAATLLVKVDATAEKSFLQIFCNF